jgi:hypothetical protein
VDIPNSREIPVVPLDEVSCCNNCPFSFAHDPNMTGFSIFRCEHPAFSAESAGPRVLRQIALTTVPEWCPLAKSEIVVRLALVPSASVAAAAA